MTTLQTQLRTKTNAATTHLKEWGLQAFAESATDVLMLAQQFKGGGDNGDYLKSKLGGTPSIVVPSAFLERLAPSSKLIVELHLSELLVEEWRGLDGEVLLIFFDLESRDHLIFFARPDSTLLSLNKEKSSLFEPFDEVPASSTFLGVSGQNNKFSGVSLETTSQLIDCYGTFNDLLVVMNQEAELETNGDFIWGQFGGYPDWNQDPELAVRESILLKDGEEWLMLFQANSVGEMQWSDCGSLQFFIRMKDYLDRNFGRVISSVSSG